MTDIKSLLDALVSAPGVSGAEDGAREAAAGFLREVCRVEATPLGSLVARLLPGAPGKPHLLLSAHLDQIGLVVTHSPENGFVRATCVGGVDRRMVSGARVEILTPGGIVPGVITSTPPHLQGADKKLPQPQLLIDTGAVPESGDCLPRPGCPVRFAQQPAMLLGGHYTAPALDNRVGCAAVIAAGLELQLANPDFAVTIALTSTEETGGAGAATAAYALGVTHAVVVDVTMAATGFEPAHKAGKLGAGPMIGFSPALHYGFSLALEKLASSINAPTQREVMPGSTGTDSENIAKSCGGIKTALLSIPLRYMHTTAETIQISDAEDTARLMAAIREDTLC